MYKIATQNQLLNVVTFTFFALVACNNQAVDTPFPLSDSGYAQPLSQPLHFSTPKKLNWVTVTTGAIKSDIKKLDIEALPSTPYNTSGFRPFAKPPKEIRFNFTALPDSAFNLEKIPSRSLQFRTSVLAPPVLIKAAPPSPKSGTPLSLYDVGVAQGLQEKDVLCLIKDKNGFIWIGTSKALYRFDGEYMQIYATHSAAGLIEDNNGMIWYTNARGIGRIDTHTGLLAYSTAINSPFPKLPKMVLDDKGHIWISQTGAKGVDIINPQTQTYQHLDRSTGLSGTDTWGIFIDDKKKIWLTTNDGIDIINPEKGRISYLKKAGNDTVRAVTGDKKGRVWVAYKHGGVAAVNIERGSITNYGSLQGLDHDLTYRLLYDGQGRVWMATNTGLSIIDTEKGMSKVFTENEGIPGDYILDLLEDDKQRIWVGSYSGGLTIIEQSAQMVYPVGKKNISTLFEDAEGNIWVGTTTEGIKILNEEKKIARLFNKQLGFSDNFLQSFLQVNGKIWITSDGGLDMIDIRHKTFEHTGKKEGLISDTVYAVLKDANGNIWLTGPSEGIQIIDSAKTSIRRASIANGLSDNNILSIKSDKQGRIWIATLRGGVDVIDPKTWTIQYLNNAPGLKDTCFRNLMPDKYGRMWIGTDKGIYVADTKQGTLTSISTKEGLSNDYISSMIEYNDYVIAGTHNMVNIITPPLPENVMGSKINQAKWKVARLAKSQGLIQGSNGWDMNIITKKGQYLWGDAGITIINTIKEEYDSAATYLTGLNIMSQMQNFANPVSLTEHDTLWTADSFYVKGQVPIHTGYVQQRRFRWDSVSGPYHMPVNLQIPYNQNSIQFQFGQAHLGRQDAALYSYMLEGIDKNWSGFTEKTVTDNYLNLPAGNYTFKVYSKDISGRWGKPAIFSFAITPPWWKTWWAYTIYILCFIGIIWGVIHYRSKQLLRENRLLEEKVAHRTRQLQQSLENLKETQTQLIQSEKMASLGELTAGIAHEIQNPLNFINNFSEVNSELIEEMEEEIQKGNLSEVKALAKDIKDNEQKINFHGKRADGIVKGMLQHSRNSTGTKEPTNINTLADEYLRLAYHGLRAKDKSFNATMQTDFDANIGSINIVSQDIGRVILNLITNAFYAVTDKKKKMTEGYDPTVFVSTKKNDDKIIIKVRDNGMGIPQKVKEKIFQPFFSTKPTGEGTGLGLSMSYDIVTKGHNGELLVATQEGEYAEFTIILPIHTY